MVLPSALQLRKLNCLQAMKLQVLLKVNQIYITGLEHDLQYLLIKVSSDSLTIYSGKSCHAICGSIVKCN